ncbi:MAG: hypothetical protein ACFFCV_10935, partial [Promethearchaeota archaeon]
SDMKLKTLIQVCKETKNTKKLAVVSFILTSNQLDEIGIKLGYRKRDKNLGETLLEYMTNINKIFINTLNIPIFREEQLEIIEECEPLFLITKGDIPFEHIKKIFVVYYDLRKLMVPNLYKELKDEDFTGNPHLGLFSFLSSGNRSRKKDANNLKPLIIHQIKNLQHLNQKELEREFNSEKLENSIHLQAIKKSLESKAKRGIMIQGPLKQNILYQKSIENIYAYFFIGLIILTISLGMILLIELNYFPIQFNSLSNWLFIIFSVAGLLILLYIKQFRREGR